MDWRAILIVLSAAGIGAGGGSFLDRQTSPAPLTRAEFEAALVRNEANKPPHPTRLRILEIEKWIERKDPMFEPPTRRWNDGRR